MGQKNFNLSVLGTPLACSWTWDSVGDAITFVPQASAPAPEFTVLPTISGTPEVGETLTGTDGTVSFGTITARQWLRDGVAISGATGSTYLLTVSDEDAEITFRNIATGDGGTVNGDSLAVGPVAEGMPSGLEVAASSLKFQPGNLQVAGRTSVLKQPTSGLSNVLTSDNSFMIFRVYIDFDRMHQNNNYVLVGNGGGGTTGRFFITYIPNASSNATLRRRLNFQMRRSSGSIYTFTSGQLNESEPGWYDIDVRRGASGVFRMDVYRVDVGLAADGAATALTQPLGGIDAFNQTHFYIGDATDVSAEATTATARGSNNNTSVGWEGAIAFMGIGDVAVSDADCEAIALGADPITRIGASNFKFARRFGFASGAPTGLGPVAGTSDTTGAATVIGTFLPGGTPGRQGTTDYITLDPVPDNIAFGVHPDSKIAMVPFSGNCGGVSFSGSIPILGPGMNTYRWRREVRFFGGQVQGRFISEAGVPRGAWQTVAATSATGVTNGRTFTENSRSAAGVKILGNGQSQFTIFCNGTSLGVTNADPIVSISRYERGTASPNPVALQTRPDVGNLRVSDGLMTMAQNIAAANDMVVHLVLNALEGTGVVDMLTDWSRTASGVTVDTEDLLAYAGDDITIDLWQWFTTDQAQGGDFGTNILGAAYLGTGPLATANKLPDIRSAQAKIVISPATRQAPTSAGPLDADPNQTIGAVRASQRAWAAANGAIIGPDIPDMRLAAGEGPHQDPTSVRGNVRIGIRMAEAVNRALGTSTSVDPSIDPATPRFAAGKASFTFEVDLPNAGSTFRTDDPAYTSNVQGLAISTTGTGGTHSRSGFTAALVQIGPNRGRVTVTKSSGDWSAVTVGQFSVSYAYGAPFGFGTSVESSELFRGGLYDGTALEGGLGLPVVPLAPTVVAEP